MRNIIILCTACAVLFASCKTTKDIVKTNTVIDSTALKQKDETIRLLKDSISIYQKTLEESTGVRVEYYPQRYDSLIFLPGKVTIDENGKIQAEGSLKNVTISKNRLEKQYTNLQNKYDSLYKTKQKEGVTVKGETQIVEKHIVRNIIPWYIWALLVLVGLAFLFKNRFTVLKWLSI